MVEKNTIHYIQLNRASKLDLESIVDSCAREIEVAIDDFELGYLEKIIKKLRYDGIISVYGLDIYEAGRLIYNGDLNLDQINKILVGKASFGGLMEVRHALQNAGLTIIERIINSDGSYLVKAQRKLEGKLGNGV